MCNRDFIVSIIENFYISNTLFLYNLGENGDCNYVLILLAILILSTYIIILRIIYILVVEDITMSKLLNLDIFIFVTIYVIFRRSSNSFYSYNSLQNCRDLQTYFNILK